MQEKAQHFDPRQEMPPQNFEVFYYKDQKLDGVAMHHHDFYEVYFFINGQVDYTVEGRHYRPRSGDVLLISPMELHQLRITAAQETYERIVLWVRPAFLHRLSTSAASLTRCFDVSRPAHTNLLRLTPAQRTGVFSKLSTLVREAYSEEYGSQLAAGGLLVQFLVELNRIALEQGSVLPAQDRTAARMEQVLEYIGQHYGEDLSLEQLAGQFFISKYHLSHQFSQLVGTSVHRYIILKRLVIAKQMLAGGVAPTDVYRNCGFCDYANFYRAFKTEYGVSPKQYAEQLR